MPDKRSLASKICVVTGAGSGIGRSAAIELLKQSMTVVLAGRTHEKLEETGNLSKEAGSRWKAIATDVADPNSVDRLFSETVSTFGRVDFLFNNAGINLPACPIEDLAITDWRNMVDVNLTGVFLCTQAAIRVMKAQEPVGGRIVNNGSVSAHVPRPNAIAYTATKHGVTGITKATSLDCREYNIACGQIDIGNASTSMTSKMSAGVLQADGTTATEPTIDVDEVGKTIAYLAGLPLEVNIPSLTIMANQMPYMGRG